MVFLHLPGAKIFPKGHPCYDQMVFPTHPEEAYFIQGLALGCSATSSGALVVFPQFYFGCDDGYIYALNEVSGSIEWRFDAESFVRASPTVNNDQAGFGGGGGWSFSRELGFLLVSR